MLLDPQISRFRTGSDGVDLESCNCGTLMAMQLGGEELMCGSCDVADGQDKRDDATQAHDNSCEVMDRCDGVAKEKTFSNTVKNTAHNKPDGSVSTSDAQMAGLSSQRTVAMTGMP